MYHDFIICVRQLELLAFKASSKVSLFIEPAGKLTGLCPLAQQLSSLRRARPMASCLRRRTGMMKPSLTPHLAII